MLDSQQHGKFGEVSKSLRIKYGYSLRDVERKIYLSKSHVQRIEQNESLPPSLDLVERFAHVLGCSPEELALLRSAYIVTVLVSIGMDRETASSFALQDNSSVPNVDLDQLFSMAQSAITHGIFEDVVRWLEPLKTLQQNISQNAPQLEYYLGDAKYGSGHLSEAGEHFEELLRLLGHPLPQSLAVRFFSTGISLLRQIRNLIFFNDPEQTPPRQNAKDENEWQLVVHACWRLSYIYYNNNDRWLATYYSLKGLNMTEASPFMPYAQDYRVRFLSNMVMAAGFVGRHSVAEMYVRRINRIEPNLGDTEIKSDVNLVVGVYYFGQAQWNECHRRLEQSAEIALERGDLRHHAISQAFVASAYYWQGNWEKSFALFDYLYIFAKKHGDQQMIALSMYSKALRALYRGKHDIALRFSQISECLAREELQDNLVQIQANGLLTKIYAHMGQLELAYKHAKRIEDLSRMTSTTAGTLEGYSRLTEFYLWGWETYGNREFKDGAKRSLKRMAAHTRMFNVFSPLYWSYRGWYEFLAGRPDKALKFAARSVKEAQELGMSAHENVARKRLRNIPAPQPTPVNLTKSD
jgi:transcriptional regulator with XRE-family HTH domain